MNHLNLHRMDASHALESHGARRFAPSQQAPRVSNIAVNRIDRLNVRGMSRVNYSLAAVQRFTARCRLRYSEIGGVVLESDGESRNAVRCRGDGERVLDAHRGFQNRHQPDWLRNARLSCDTCDRTV